MNVEYKKIALKSLQPNAGQIAGVPKNPRDWMPEEIENLCDSIKETPELLDARGLIVVPNEGYFVVIGGNMRLAALSLMGAKNAPCIVLEGLPAEKIREIVIKDNSSFGQWDAEELKAEWGDIDMSGWGIDTGWMDMKMNNIERQEKSEETRTLEFTLDPDDYYAAVGVLRGFDSDNTTALKMALDLV